VIAALGLGACGQASVGPPPAVSAPMEQISAASIPDFRAQAGMTYAEFTAQPAMQRYALEGLGVAGTAEARRFNHAMANQVPGLVAGGGGAQALVFSGCAPSGCLEGLSVVAIDIGTGDVFVGVSDMAGAEKLVPNDRLEALLRLTSPSQSWDDPIRTTAVAAAGP